MTGHEQRFIKAVAKAIDGVRLFSRLNDFTSDAKAGYPIEICRYGGPGEPDIVVIKQHKAGTDEGQALREAVSEQRAIAAIDVCRNYDERR
jgi:hypothetical protein